MTKTAAPAPTKCLGCDRTLRSTKSIARQRGPLCHARFVAAANLATAFKDPEAAADKALQVIADKAIVPTRHKGQYLVTASHGDDTYLVDVVEGSCTCKAGSRLGRCSHLVAAHIVEITAIRRVAAYVLAA